MCVCVCVCVCTYLASCFHHEKKSAEPMTVSSKNLLIKTGSLSTSWWGLPPTLYACTNRQVLVTKFSKQRNTYMYPLPETVYFYIYQIEITFRTSDNRHIPPTHTQAHTHTLHTHMHTHTHTHKHTHTLLVGILVNRDMTLNIRRRHRQAVCFTPEVASLYSKDHKYKQTHTHRC